MIALKRGALALLNRVLPVRLKKALLHASFHLTPDEFEKFAHAYYFAPSMRLGLAALAARGFTPTEIIDVGAYEGNWSIAAKAIWPDAALTMVEPNEAKLSLLSKIAGDLNGGVVCELLGANDGETVTFYVMGSGSSVMNEHSSLPRTKVQRPLKTLDSLLRDAAGPALLKIDAQGYELEILKGASRVLTTTEAVLLEVSLIEINKGAPLFHDVIAFMQDRGFLVADILEIHRRPLDGATNQIDLLFLRDSSPLFADKRHFAPTATAPGQND